MKKIITCLMACAMVLMTTSCKDKEDGAAVSDQQYYNVLACTVLTAISNVYNQNIAGTSTQTSEWHINAPYGGTIHISGSINTGDNGLTRVDLDYMMEDVKWYWSSDNSSLSSEVTMTGVVHEVGSFKSADNYSSLSKNSDNLRMTGVVKSGGDSRTVDEQGKKSLVSSVGSYDGSMFGYTVNN